MDIINTLSLPPVPWSWHLVKALLFWILWWEWKIETQHLPIAISFLIGQQELPPEMIRWKESKEVMEVNGMIVCISDCWFQSSNKNYISFRLGTAKIQHFFLFANIYWLFLHCFRFPISVVSDFSAPHFVLRSKWQGMGAFRPSKALCPFLSQLSFTLVVNNPLPLHKCPDSIFE